MAMSVAELIEKARTLRLSVVRMIGVGQTGHLGGSCSIADAVTALYYYKMRHDPKKPQWPARDRFLLSKGHAALIQYAVLADFGYFPASELTKIKHLGAMLQGHPDMERTPGIEANTGSLGQGLSIACGMAAGLRLNGGDSRVYCVIGDGELDEGQIWEAAMAAHYYCLDNLTAFLDLNGMQATGFTEGRFDTRPLREKWTAMGWRTWEIDGHDMAGIVETLDAADSVRGDPKMIVLRTIKGKGVSFAEGNSAFHNGRMTQAQFNQACRELEA